MRARWEGLHEALVRFISTLDADRQFLHARSVTHELARFDSAAGLLASLTSRDGNLDEKDAIYVALVRAVQERVVWSSFAMHALWCGLWPGLDAVYRRRLHHFGGDADELTSALSSTFTTLVGRLALHRVRRVAATLIRSTERDLMEHRRRQVIPVPHDHLEDVEGVEAIETSPSVLGIQHGLSEAAQGAAVLRWLKAAGGNDGALFLAVAMHGDNQRELADQLGISHDALRKRLQRVRAKLIAALSHPGREIRVSEAHESEGRAP